MRCTSFLLSLLLGLVWAGAAAAAPSDGVKSNVTVRGFWSISVVNADGSVASKTEFENAYLPSNLLASLLARRACATGLLVTLEAPDANKACRDEDDGLSNCFIFEPGGNPNNHPFASDSLERSVDNNALVLSGSIVTSGGEVQVVRTRVGSNDCNGDGQQAYELTQHLLPDAIPVAAGQQVQVTVTITFGAIQ